MVNVPVVINDRRYFRRIFQAFVNAATPPHKKNPRHFQYLSIRVFKYFGRIFQCEAIARVLGVVVFVYVFAVFGGKTFVAGFGYVSSSPLQIDINKTFVIVQEFSSTSSSVSVHFIIMTVIIIIIIFIIVRPNDSHHLPSFIIRYMLVVRNNQSNAQYVHDYSKHRS